MQDDPQPAEEQDETLADPFDDPNRGNDPSIPNDEALDEMQRD